MSQNIVVAGAGALGKHVLDELLASQQFNTVTVLSRSAKPELERKGAIVKVVDYDSLPSLNAALAGADTLLSFIVDFSDPKSQARAHRHLLSAAVSQGLARFVPAEYANDLARFPVPPSAERDKLTFRELVREVCERERMEYTLVCNGIFMDFFLPRGGKKYFPDLPQLTPVDFEARPPRVRVFGDPGQKISFTLADDLARCMVRLLKVPLGEWEAFTYVSGDRVTWEEMASMLEDMSGERVERVYVGLDELRRRVQEVKGRRDDIEVMKAELDEAFGNGSEVLPENSSFFEGMKFTSMREVVEKHHLEAHGG